MQWSAGVRNRYGYFVHGNVMGFGHSYQFLILSHNSMGLSFKKKDKPAKKVEEKEDDKLYVVLPYFNFCSYKKRKQLFLEFVERIKNVENVVIVICEAKGVKQLSYDLPFNIPGVFAHFRFEVSHTLWIKENLINLAIERLPRTWKYVAWIDADITFLNANWAKETVQKLEQEADVLQLFQTSINTGHEGQGTKLDQGFMYMYLKSGRPYTKTYKYGFWHPGYAWAINRTAYAAMDGLIDWGVLGSGDHHMALAFIGKVDMSHPGGLQDGYKDRLKQFQERCADANLRLGYVDGMIVHHYHGSLENRKYRERWAILVDGKYNPEKDIVKNKFGVVQFTEIGQRLEKNIVQYFEERKEDE